MSELTPELEVKIRKFIDHPFTNDPLLAFERSCYRSMLATIDQLRAEVERYKAAIRNSPHGHHIANSPIDVCHFRQPISTQFQNQCTRDNCIWMEVQNG